jgi:multicomponent Na+:H+ antiporter subunit D
MERDTGTTQIGDMGGLYRHRPLLATVFVVPAFSLAGFPPFPGFWGKLTLVQAGLAQEQWVLVAIALVVGLLTLLVVAQVWGRAFWQTETAPLREGGSRGTRSLLNGPVVALAVGLLALGLYAEPVFAFAQTAAGHLTDPAPYVQAVLGA